MLLRVLIITIDIGAIGYLAEAIPKKTVRSLHNKNRAQRTGKLALHLIQHPDHQTPKENLPARINSQKKFQNAVFPTGFRFSLEEDQDKNDLCFNERTELEKTVVHLYGWTPNKPTVRIVGKNLPKCI